MTTHDHAQQDTTQDTASRETPPTGDLTRRMMLRSAAVGGVAMPLLAACGGNDSSSGGSDSGSDKDSDKDSDSSGGSSDSGGSSGSTTVQASDVPVGGGTIVKADKVVVTQPSKGDYKAFSAVCTHQGCLVGSVANKQIVCPCHGSHYSISDGSVESGPAPKPLPAKKVSVKDGTITVT